MDRRHIEQRLAGAVLNAAPGGAPPTGPAARIAGAALGLVRRMPPGDLPLSRVNAEPHLLRAARSGHLTPASEFLAGPPSPWHAPVAEPSRRTPVLPLSWSVHEKVLVNSTSLALQGDRLISPSRITQALDAGLQLKGPGIAYSARSSALVVTSPVTDRIRSAIRLCGTGSGNWYHWLVEILPSATLVPHLPEDLRDLPILVPDVVLGRPAWRDALESILPGRRLVPTPRTGFLEVEQLVWLDAAVQGARTFHEHVTPDIDASVPVLPVLQRFRELVRQHVGIGAERGRRILLVRPAGAQRSANQAELIQVAHRHGLAPVDPGTLSFAEQVRLFAEAELVAGGWGAAWSSMLFADTKTRGLMWAPEHFRRWTLFSNLAPVSGMSLRHIHVPTAGDGFRAANRAPQTVPPEEFDAALASLS